MMLVDIRNSLYFSSSPVVDFYSMAPSSILKTSFVDDNHVISQKSLMQIVPGRDNSFVPSTTLFHSSSPPTSFQ